MGNKNKVNIYEMKARDFSNSFSIPKREEGNNFHKNKSKYPKKKKKLNPTTKKPTENTWVLDDKVVTGWTALCCKDINFKNPKLTAFCDFKEQISGLVRRNSFWETKKPLSLYLLSFEEELLRVVITNSSITHCNSQAQLASSRTSLCFFCLFLCYSIML